MKTIRWRTILLAVVTSLATLGAVFYLDSGNEGDSYSLVNVGGTMNKCSCSQRLER